MSDAPPPQDVPAPASDPGTGKAADTAPALTGSTAPKAAAKPTSKRRGHAEATDVTIDILREELAQQRESHEAELSRLREAQQVELSRLRMEQKQEREALQAACTAQQTKCDELITRWTDLVVEKERLSTENVAIRREQTRGRLLEFIAALLLGVGGGVVSYTQDQRTKDYALLALLTGGGVFALHFLAGLILGAFPQHQRDELKGAASAKTDVGATQDH